MISLNHGTLSIVLVLCFATAVKKSLSFTVTTPCVYYVLEICVRCKLVVGASRTILTSDTLSVVLLEVCSVP